MIKKSVSVLLFLLVGLSRASAQDESRYNAVYHFQNLSQVLDITRDFLTREPIRKIFRVVFKEELLVSEEVQKRHQLPTKLRELSESHFLEVLANHREVIPTLDAYLDEVTRDEVADGVDTEEEILWAKRIEAAFDTAEISATVVQIMQNPMRAFPVYGPTSMVGYNKMVMYANHPIVYIEGNQRKKVPASNMKEQIIRFIKSTKKQLVLNVFDFDLLDVANALVEAGKRGVEVRVGIDAAVIKQRPQVQAVVERLVGQKNIRVHAVNSVGLNHQKLIASDWSLPSQAKVLMSSGNFTQSCIGPEGDAIAHNIKHEYSVPNANHMIVLYGVAPALIIQHELSKTLDEGFHLRGKEYPISGAFQFFGPRARISVSGFGKTATMRTYNPNIILSFTPGGGLGDVNRDIIAETIRRSSGPIRMTQFVASSLVVENALYDKFLEQKNSAGTILDFASVADTPFALRDFSLFLKMSGWQLNPDESKGPKYILNSQSRWAEAMSAKEFSAFQSKIKVAPRRFGNHWISLPDGSKKVEINAKIHHKMLVTEIAGNSVSITGSYNFSDAAGSNQEYIAVISDERFGSFARAIFNGLYFESMGSVSSEVQRRNNRKDYSDDEGDDVVDFTDSESRAAEKSQSNADKP